MKERPISILPSFLQENVFARLDSIQLLAFSIEFLWGRAIISAGNLLETNKTERN